MHASTFSTVVNQGCQHLKQHAHITAVWCSKIMSFKHSNAAHTASKKSRGNAKGAVKRTRQAFCSERQRQEYLVTIHTTNHCQAD